jgi:ribonuclease HI/probable phosphoglycerate mutase
VEAPVFWELPTGKIKFGEQPEEAITRTLDEYLGITPATIELKDVITFIAPDGASRLDNLYIIYEITTTDKPEPKIRYTAFKYINDPATAGVHLNNASVSVLEIESGQTVVNHQSARDTASSAVVYVDGASRGNPGPSGIGYYIKDATGKVIDRGGEFIGFTTSRSAEYYAMRKGVERAIELGLRSVRFISDNLMMVNQLAGVIRPKNADIIPIYDSIETLMSKFDSVAFIHVPREENEEADAEANRAIDNIMKS